MGLWDGDEKSESGSQFLDPENIGKIKHGYWEVGNYSFYDSLSKISQILASKNEPCDDDSEITDQLHLLESGDQSDLILVCQNKIFNVHSHIISARSDILKALINELTDKRSLVIKDIGTHALEKILHYMYSGKLPIMSIESALKVYEASERYLLQGLKRKCAALIKSKLNETNVCDVLAFSNRLEETYLKDAVITYLLRNKSFLKSEIWRRFSNHNQELANEVHLAYVKAY